MMGGKLGPYLLGPNDENQGIYTGDARDLAKAIPDESVDLIFTDPPYAQEYLPLYEWLAKIAKRILKPGASCLAFSGTAHFPEVLFSMWRYLRWFTCLCQPNNDGAPRIWNLKLRKEWKPVVWFTKGEGIPPHHFVNTMLRGHIDKRFHQWGQGVEYPLYIINQLLYPEAIVFDPFCGGGQVPAAAKIMYCRYLAFEIDPETTEIARRRVAQTQPPLFVLQPEQVAMFEEAE